MTNITTATIQLTDAIHAQVLGGRKLADVVRQIVADLSAPDLIAETMTAARRETVAKLDRLIKIEANKGNATDSLKKSHLNAWGYAAKVASELAGVKFVYSRKAGGFLVEELKAANETAPTTAAGKDQADPKATSEAIQQNADPAIEQNDALDVFKGAVSVLVKGGTDFETIVRAMVDSGAGIKALTDAVQQVAGALAIESVQQAAEQQALADLNQPKAGKILAEKLVNKPAQKKRAAKAVA